MNRLFFDIETGPLPDTELAKIKPEFEAPANYKDAAKIEAYKKEQETKWKENAALHAETGMLLAVGFMDRAQKTDISMINKPDDEHDLIVWALNTINDALLDGKTHVLGFYIFGFDLPFLVRRAWKLEVGVPLSLRAGRYWNERLGDVADTWKMGNRDQTISLKRLALHLGVGDKDEDIAKDFAGLMVTDRPKAEAYLRNDINLVRLCSEKMMLG